MLPTILFKNKNHHLALTICSLPICQYFSCAVLCLVAHLYVTLYNRMDVAHKAPLSMGILQARMLERVAMPSPGDLSNPGIQPRSPALQPDSLLSELPGK